MKILLTAPKVSSSSDSEKTFDIKGLSDRGDTLIGDTGIGIVDAITGAIGRTGYALPTTSSGLMMGLIHLVSVLALVLEKQGKV